LAAIHLLNKADAAVATHGDGDHHPGEQHGVSKGQNGKLWRSALRVHLLLVLGRDQGDQFGLVLELFRAEKAVSMKDVVHRHVWSVCQL
jgi:hypothetical protein